VGGEEVIMEGIRLLAEVCAAVDLALSERREWAMFGVCRMHGTPRRWDIWLNERATAGDPACSDEPSAWYIGRSQHLEEPQRKRRAVWFPCPPFVYFLLWFHGESVVLFPFGFPSVVVWFWACIIIIGGVQLLFFSFSMDSVAGVVDVPSMERR
jgi:hypothetical protein